MYTRWWPGSQNGNPRKRSWTMCARIWITLIVVSLSITYLPMHGQTGRITGQVIDPTAASVPGAAVTLTNTGTRIRTPTSTNAEGYYTLPLVDPGYYAITVARS